MPLPRLILCGHRFIVIILPFFPSSSSSSLWTLKRKGGSPLILVHGPQEGPLIFPAGAIPFEIQAAMPYCVLFMQLLFVVLGLPWVYSATATSDFAWAPFYRYYSSFLPFFLFFLPMDS